VREPQNQEIRYQFHQHHASCRMHGPRHAVFPHVACHHASYMYHAACITRQGGVAHAPSRLNLPPFFTCACRTRWNRAMAFSSAVMPSRSPNRRSTNELLLPDCAPAETSPAANVSELGDAKSSLGDAKSSLGDAQRPCLQRRPSVSVRVARNLHLTRLLQRDERGAARSEQPHSRTALTGLFFRAYRNGDGRGVVPRSLTAFP
jgi:hypothetical protein